jgi:hypothetical protein
MNRAFPRKFADSCPQVRLENFLRSAQILRNPAQFPTGNLASRTSITKYDYGEFDSHPIPCARAFEIVSQEFDSFVNQSALL